MKNLILVSTLLASTSVALAEPGVDRSMPAVDSAFELSVGLLFAHNKGDIGNDMPAVEDVGGPGAGIEGSLGWRATPNLFLGGYTNLSGFGSRYDSDKGAATATLGLKADWHFMPFTSLDPWVSLGTGVKFLGIEAGERDRALTGLELAKVQLGFDYRLSPTFAIAPMVGISASMFDTQYDEAVSDDAMAIDDKQINWTFSAGVLVRFDTFATTR